MTRLVLVEDRRGGLDVLIQPDRRSIEGVRAALEDYARPPYPAGKLGRLMAFHLAERIRVETGRPVAVRFGL